jgi:hypothetical protein
MSGPRAGDPHSKEGPETALDRVDQTVRPAQACHHSVVEPSKPRHLQEFWLRQIEDECRDADAEHLCEYKHAERTEPVAARQLHNPRNLSGRSSSTGTMNTTSVAAGGRRSIKAASRAVMTRSGMRATIQATIGARWLQATLRTGRRGPAGSGAVGAGGACLYLKCGAGQSQRSKDGGKHAQDADQNEHLPTGAGPPRGLTYGWRACPPPTPPP